jgi:hypothetical protein
MDGLGIVSIKVSLIFTQAGSNYILYLISIFSQTFTSVTLNLNLVWGSYKNESELIQHVGWYVL